MFLLNFVATIASKLTYSRSTNMNANTIIENFKSHISEIIREQTLSTLTRLRSKIFNAVDIEDDFEIDMDKFAENTMKKIIEESSSLFSEVEEGIKKAAEKVPKLKKDPDAPKAAVNAYILFSRDNRDDVKSENPDMKAIDITKKLAEMWKESDEDLKKEYKEKSEQDKERYTKELESYVPKEGFQNPKEKKTKSKKTKKTGPKKPLNAYMWFCNDKRDELKGKGFNNTEILREMGRLWKELTDKKKKPYLKKAEEDKERYEEEMKNYVPTEEEKAALLQNEEKNKGKKGKKAKNVNKESKRPLGAFMLFRKDKYQQVKEENPDMKMGDIMKEIGDMWKNLSEKEKKKYTDQAAKLLAEFKQKNSGDNQEKNEEKNEENDDNEESEESGDSEDNEDNEENEDSEDDKNPKKKEVKKVKEDKKEVKKVDKKVKKDDDDDDNSIIDEDDEELDIPLTGTPTKCMPIIVSDAKFAKMKEEEEKKKKEEKKADKKSKKTDKKSKKADKKSKKNNKDSDDEEILTDSE